MVNYAIVGGGRLARHFSRYFQYLGIPHSRWTRDSRSRFNTSSLTDAEQRLRETIADADRVMLLVSDAAIAALPRQYPFLFDKQLVHCSGALSIPGIAGAHPLMTFAEHLYPLETYQSVPFLLESGNAFSDLLPGLPNPHFEISVENKPRYHAMCVMAGNFTQLMWQGIYQRFEQQLGLPATALQPYLEQVTRNFIQAPESALTGPLSRDDRQTIERNIHSLDGDALRDLYLAFVNFYQQGEKPAQRLEQVI